MAKIDDMVDGFIDTWLWKRVFPSSKNKAKKEMRADLEAIIEEARREVVSTRLFSHEMEDR